MFLERGFWKPAKDGDKASATIACPKCGAVGWLDHEIDADGNVSPSVECMERLCDFHAMIRLEGWVA